MHRLVAAGACALALLLVPAVPAAAAPPAITAAGAVLWDPADARVLHGVDEAVARPPASTTKVMTVLLAIEAGAVDDVVTVSAAAAAQGEASLELRAGQRIPMRSLLAGLVLRSGNDAAVAVAEHVAGSVEAFVDKMNARAAELGMTDTHFLNPTGLTNDPAHRSSPLDLTRLAEVAMAHPDFAGWASAARLTVPGLPPMVSRNELLVRYPGATGVKTGYTALAGLCLVFSATRDGRTLYGTVLGSEDSFADSAALLEHGFSDFRRVEPAVPGAAAVRYRWAGADVGLVPGELLGRTVPVDAAVTWRAVLRPGVERPVAAGAVLGHAELLVDGVVEDRTDLVAQAPVPARAAAAPAGAVGAAVHDALRAFAALHPVERAA